MTAISSSTAPAGMRRHKRSTSTVLLLTLAVFLLAVVVQALPVARGDDDLMEAAAMPPLGGLALRAVRPRVLAEQEAEASSSGSGSSTAPTPTTKKPRTPFVLTSSPGYVNTGTVAPVVEPTFFGLFPTKNLYLGAAFAIVGLFALYKLGLACWFCTAGRRKFAKEDREREQRALQMMEDAKQAAMAAAAAGQQQQQQQATDKKMATGGPKY